MNQPIESSFEKLLVRLVRDDIRFVTVGGIAVCLNGFVRLTEDVDILIAPDRQNCERLIKSLSTFGEGYAAELSPDDFDDAGGAIRIVEEVEDCQIDIFTVMQGLRYEDLVPECLYFESNNIRIPYLSLKGLIRLKEKTHREKDAIDVDALRQLQRNPNAFD